MAILDSGHIFQKDWEMPNAGTDICDYYYDWTASKWKDWINTPQPLWIIVTCTGVPSAGTSIKVEIYQHSTSTLTSGDLLIEGPIVVRANLAADPYDDGHILLAVPFATCMQAAQIMGGQDRYFGPVLRADGDCSSGQVDAWVHMGVNPPVYVAPPSSSNVVMPS